jgi:hypothetical protein
VLSLLAACERAPKSDSAPAPSAAPSASLAVASATPVASHPWFEGAWQGTFNAELSRIELAVGGVKEWKQDEGKLASGPGKLQLQIAADGAVSGSASGALGDLHVTGQADADRVALTLTSAAPEGFHGFVLASPAADGMQGALSASSADSLQVRKAAVTLTRAAP